MALAGFAFTRVLPIQESAAAAAPVPEAVDYYDKLGITKIINAAGTYTYLTASTMPPSVQAAVALSSQASGISRGPAESGWPISRSSIALRGCNGHGWRGLSAVTLATAACMTVAKWAFRKSCHAFGDERPQE